MTVFQAILFIALGYILAHFVAAVKLGYKDKKFEEKLKKDLKSAMTKEGARPTLIRSVELPTVVDVQRLQSMEGETFDLFRMSDGSTRWYLPIVPNRVE